MLKIILNAIDYIKYQLVSSLYKPTLLLYVIAYRVRLAMETEYNPVPTADRKKW